MKKQKTAILSIVFGITVSAMSAIYADGPGITMSLITPNNEVINIQSGTQTVMVSKDKYCKIYETSKVIATPGQPAKDKPMSNVFVSCEELQNHYGVGATCIKEQELISTAQTEGSNIPVSGTFFSCGNSNARIRITYDGNGVCTHVESIGGTSGRSRCDTDYTKPQ